MGGYIEGRRFVFGCCPRGWETQCGASKLRYDSWVWCRTYIQRQACRQKNRKSGAADRTPFFCKSLSCAKHHAAGQASCASFTQTSRMRWVGGRVAAASVSALSLFPAACSTAVLCYHPPRACLFFRYHSSANLTAVRPVVAASASAACCLLLLLLRSSPSHALPLLLLSLPSPLVCVLPGGFYTPLLSATTNTATTSSPITHPPTQPPSPFPIFRRVASLPLLPLPFYHRGSPACSVVPSEQGDRKGSKRNTRTHTP